MVRPIGYNRQRRLILLRILPVTALLDTSMILVFWGCTRYYNLFEENVLNVFAAFIVPERILFATSILKVPIVRRALFSALNHRKKLHLTLDLAWTLVTGIELENALGSWRFLCNVGMMHTISQGFRAIFYFLVTDKRPSGSVGFSGVLLGLNFVLLVSPRGRPRRRRGFSAYHVLMASVPMLIVLRAIAPDASLEDNIAGVLAGFVFANMPPIMDGFVGRVLLLYNEALRLISPLCERSIWGREGDEIEDWQDAIGWRYENGADGREETNEEASRRRHGPGFSMQEESDRRDQDQKGQEFDKLLEWRCRACFKTNGVFFILCEVCRAPRDVQSTFNPYRHSCGCAFNGFGDSNRHVLRHPSLRMHFAGESHRLIPSTLQLPNHKAFPETPSAPPSVLCEPSNNEAHCCK